MARQWFWSRCDESRVTPNFILKLSALSGSPVIDSEQFIPLIQEGGVCALRIFEKVKASPESLDAFEKSWNVLKAQYQRALPPGAPGISRKRQMIPLTQKDLQTVHNLTLPPWWSSKLQHDLIEELAAPQN